MKSILCYVLLTILLCDRVSYTATIEVKKIVNNGLQKSLSALVVLPQSYKNSTQRFPVLYALHGYSGNYRTLSDVIDLRSCVDSFSIILVCPDGYFSSWYLNSPCKKEMQFDTYVTTTIVSYIDSAYRTIPHYTARAIIGSSMGGHGALTLLARHPEIYCWASSISGILDLTQFPDQWGVDYLLGPYESNKTVWRNHSFIELVRNLQKYNRGIYIDCGKADFAFAVNMAAHRTLDSLGIPHESVFREGDHSYTYVKKVFFEHVAKIIAFMYSIKNKS